MCEFSTQRTVLAGRQKIFKANVTFIENHCNVCKYLGPNSLWSTASVVTRAIYFFLAA